MRESEGWIAGLGLEPPAGESGWWRHADASALAMGVGDARLPAFSAIYHLLDAERPVHVRHRLDSDDTHVLIDGGPVEHLVLHEEREPARLVLGRDLEAGQTPRRGCRARNVA